MVGRRQGTLPCIRFFRLFYGATMAYHLEGRLLEVCNCRVLCPCWIGEDPDFGTCDTIVAWHFDKGTIDGIDVAGRTIAMIAHVPGNILQGNWTAAVYLDDKVTQAAGGRAPRRLHRARRAGPSPSSRSSSAKSSRSRRSPSRSRSRAATERSSWATRATPSSSRTRAPPARRRRSPTPCSRRCPGRRCSSARRRRYRSKNAKVGIDLDIKGHNALQSTFVFQS